MTYQEFNTEFRSHVAQLDRAQKLELALGVCKALLPDYNAFLLEHNWGDLDLLLDGIALCGCYIDGTSTAALSEMLLKIDEVTPDTGDFEDASYALNACCAITDTIEFLIDRDSQHIVSVGIYLTDTIDFKIQEERTLSEEQINGHPLMINARNFLLGSR